MSIFRIFLLVLILSAGKTALAQKEISFSDYRNEDDLDISFEILGKMKGNYLIYKSVRWKHMLAYYDSSMHLAKSMRISFIPEKTFNIDFITYPDFFYMVYQYQKNSVVYCMGVKMGVDGKKLSEPVLMDTTKLGLLADNKIYSTIYSQDKQKIMVYKMLRKNQDLTIVSKIYNASLAMIDSTREVTQVNDKTDSYGDIYLANNGDQVLTKLSLTNFGKKINGVEMMIRQFGAKKYIVKPISFTDKFFDDINVKLDNQNGQCIVNSLYYEKGSENIKGVFSVLMNIHDGEVKKMAFNEFSDSLRSIASKTVFKSAFDNFSIQQVIAKKDGGFIMAAEDNYVQARYSQSYVNRYNSLGTFDNYNTGYYSNSAYYNGFYRPFSSFNNYQSQTFYYDNILVLSFDSSLTMQWNVVIPKEQTDEGNDNFLSYSIMNMGRELHFLYVERLSNTQVVSNQSVQPNGTLKRYPTFKSREKGFEFMPRSAKQVDYGEMIIPCVYRNNVAFARVIFDE